MGRILETIRARAAARGFATPELVTGMLGDRHPLLKRVRYRAPMPETDRLMVGDELSPDFHRWVERVVDLLLCCEAWARLPGERRPGQVEPWANLCHPLLAAAAARNPGQGVSVDQHLVYGSANLSYGTPRIEATAHFHGATLTIRARIPESVRHVLAGRRVAEIVEMPTTGIPHIDEAVGGLVVASGMEDVLNSGDVGLVMRPAPWIAMAEPPPEAARWWEANPFAPDA